MPANTSHAVMAQRAEPHDSLDDFPSPPWGTRALFEMFERRGLPQTTGSCWEPACNRGYMVRPLKERFADVQATDVHDYGFGFGVRDFLWVDRWMEDPDDYIQPDWIITNPPFRLGKEFALAAFQRAKIGCALLVRTAFLEGGDRYRSLYQARRPHYVFQFVERLPMVKGRCDPDASTATSYAWLVWLPCEIAAPDTIFDWIPPCRAKLEKPGDYRAMEPD